MNPSDSQPSKATPYSQPSNPLHIPAFNGGGASNFPATNPSSNQNFHQTQPDQQQFSNQNGLQQQQQRINSQQSNNMVLPVHRTSSSFSSGPAVNNGIPQLHQMYQNRVQQPQQPSNNINSNIINSNNPNNTPFAPSSMPYQQPIQMQRGAPPTPQQLALRQQQQLKMQQQQQLQLAQQQEMMQAMMKKPMANQQHQQQQSPRPMMNQQYAAMANGTPNYQAAAPQTFSYPPHIEEIMIAQRQGRSTPQQQVQLQMFAQQMQLKHQQQIISQRKIASTGGAYTPQQQQHLQQQQYLLQQQQRHIQSLPRNDTPTNPQHPSSTSQKTPQQFAQQAQRPSAAPSHHVPSTRPVTKDPPVAPAPVGPVSSLLPYINTYAPRLRKGGTALVVATAPEPTRTSSSAPLPPRKARSARFRPRDDDEGDERGEKSEEEEEEEEDESEQVVKTERTGEGGRRSSPRKSPVKQEEENLNGAGGDEEEKRSVNSNFSDNSSDADAEDRGVVSDYHRKKAMMEAQQQQQALQQTYAKQKIDATMVALPEKGKFFVEGYKPRKRKRLLKVTRHEWDKIQYYKSTTLISRPELLVPINIDLDLSGFKIQDTFMYNLNETLLTPEKLAEYICEDLGLQGQISMLQQTPSGVAQMQMTTFQAGIGKSVRGQIEGFRKFYGDGGGDVPVKEDTRITIHLDLRLGRVRVRDKFEWDLASELEPEQFARQMAQDLGLGGEFTGLISHSIRDQLFKSRSLKDYESTFPIEKPFRSEEEARAWSPFVELGDKKDPNEEENDEDGNGLDEDRNTRLLRRQQREQALGAGRRGPVQRGYFLDNLRPIIGAIATTILQEGGMSAEERAKWRCAHCLCLHDKATEIKDGPSGKETLCQSCGLYYAEDGVLPPHRWQLFK